MSKVSQHFPPLEESTWTLLSLLALGLEGNAVVTITASTHGLTLKIAGKIVARGKDAKELRARYDRWLAEQKAVADHLEAQIAELDDKTGFEMNAAQLRKLADWRMLRASPVAAGEGLPGGRSVGRNDDIRSEKLTRAGHRSVAR